MLFKKHLMLKVMVSILWSMTTFSYSEQIQVEVRAHTVGALKMLVVVIDESNELISVGHILQKDLSFTKQFAVDLNFTDRAPTKQEVDELHRLGYQIALFVEPVHNEKSITWRLYDLAGAQMIKGKKYIKRGAEARGWAHAIADMVWPILAQTPGFFSTKIAYCKDVKDKHAKAIKHVCVADYDGSNEQILVDTHTLNVAPRWNMDPDYPMVFYTEHTNSNARLVMSTMDKKKRVIINFDGLTMLPSFSPDGKRVAFCASRGDGQCDLYCFEKGNLKRLTRNQGNNISPVFAQDSQTLYYCSDVTGAPQIFSYNFETNKHERITTSGYCACPAYSFVNKSLAYIKNVGGTMQLFVYHTITKEHTQLTFDAGNKDECSWSVCGNYLLYGIEKGLKSRIAMLHIPTKEKRFITAASDVCSYPTWSPVYAQLPVVS